MTGRFITLEGGEGAGKSTQARLLAEELEQRGISVDLTREPGGTSGAEAIRQLLLDPGESPWGARAEALLFAAARADHVEKRIVPALAAGRWVICDRFVDSSRAYQGGAGGLDDADLMDLHRVGSGGLLPDMTLLLLLPAEIAQQRLSRRASAETDAIEARGDAYHARVDTAFKRLAEAEPARFSIIDSGGDVAQTHAAIMAALAPLLVATDTPC
ncbi:MAG: dTMP kinase [Novosphingobium sp.]|nr:dTMP kinase [Novosphingobium sp.]